MDDSFLEKMSPRRNKMIEITKKVADEAKTTALFFNADPQGRRSRIKIT